MNSDREIAAHADPQLAQHFLVSAGKLARLVAAAGIGPADHVLEVGAGIGTVARALPESRTLTVVELDQRLTGFLRENVPHAKILQGDTTGDDFLPPQPDVSRIVKIVRSVRRHGPFRRQRTLTKVQRRH
jgi:16S rRNA A1518/A1519 N6-dimethyltransferase RsmA/KsgA/DIM1 with predicted DNA glycosylase/AP lyase activity